MYLYTYPGNRRRFGGRPSQRAFPASAAAWAAAFPSLPAPLALWAFQESASPVLDLVGSQHLIENQVLLYQRTGEIYPRDNPRLVLEFDTAASNRFTASADAAAFDLPSDANRSLIVRLKMPDNGGVVRAIAGTSSVNSGARWGLRTTAGGVLVALASDETTPIQANSVAICDDGLWHDALFVWDRTAGTPALRAGLDGAALVSTNLGALSAVDAPTGMRVGSVHSFSPVVGQQISYAAWFGAALTAADFAAFRAPVRL